MRAIVAYWSPERAELLADDATWDALDRMLRARDWGVASRVRTARRGADGSSTARRVTLSPDDAAVVQTALREARHA